MENDIDLMEMAKICGKYLKYLTNGLNIVENDLEIWEMAKIIIIIMIIIIIIIMSVFLERFSM